MLVAAFSGVVMPPPRFASIGSGTLPTFVAVSRAVLVDNVVLGVTVVLTFELRDVIIVAAEVVDKLAEVVFVTFLDDDVLVVVLDEVVVLIVVKDEVVVVVLDEVVVLVVVKDELAVLDEVVLLVVAQFVTLAHGE